MIQIHIKRSDKTTILRFKRTFDHVYEAVGYIQCLVDYHPLLRCMKWDEVTDSPKTFRFLVVDDSGKRKRIVWQSLDYPYKRINSSRNIKFV